MVLEGNHLHIKAHLAFLLMHFHGKKSFISIIAF